MRRRPPAPTRTDTPFPSTPFFRSFLGCGAAIAGSLWRARQSRFVTTYGSARWASRREIARAGLYRDAGVMLGRSDGRYLRHDGPRSEEHTSELQSLMRISYAVFCLKKKKNNNRENNTTRIEK